MDVAVTVVGLCVREASATCGPVIAKADNRGCLAEAVDVSVDVTMG